MIEIFGAVEMNEPELAASLAAAGLVYLGMEESCALLLPPTLANLATGYPPEGEPPGGVSVELSDPRLLEKANAGWYEASLEVGLFNEQREFLVAIDRGDNAWWWARVRLTDTWDIMGVGAAGVLGIRWCLPRFVMTSVDCDVIVCGTDWESSIGCLLARPRRSQRFRDFAVQWAEYDSTSEFERAATRRWLTR